MNKTPKLRFKEFSGDWESKKLGKITKLTDGVHFTPTYVESGVPFWSVETVVSNANPKYITQEAHNNAMKRCHPQVNDILLTRIGTLAKPKLIDWNEELSIYVSLALIKASENYNSRFARYYFETQYYQKDFLSKSLLTATPKKINMEDLKQTNINLPSKEEQEKIASFFSLIDDKISLQGEKLKMLKDYKTGMMQKIFSRELRFKDDCGMDYPEWEDKMLRDIVYFNKKITYGVVKPGNYDKDGVILIKSRDYSTGWKFDDLFKISTTLDNSYKRSKVSTNDILYTIVGSVGNVAIVPEELNGANITQQTARISVNEENSYVFVYNFLKGDFNKKQLSNYLKSGVQPSINLSDLEVFKINVPVKEEQEKIAAFLLNIDKKLEKEQEKLDSLNKYKKGLLQQMFV